MGSSTLSSSIRHPFLWWTSAFLAIAWPLPAAEPLHQRIDAVIAKAHPEGQAGIVGDEEYLRRIYLALHGVIPSATQAREFFADTSPDKRVKLVDALLAHPQFARWMAVSFDIMLMERRPEAHTKTLPWREWLEESFRVNKPWDALVREVVTADGADEKTRHIARWMLERQADPNALTKDVGRVFLGRDISCAQCHDHPRIDDYLQRDYAGIQAFFSRTYLFQPDKKKPAIVAEQATGETSYLSVFTKVGGDTKPRLPGGSDVKDPSTGEWLVAPSNTDKNLRAIPKQSRRALLATALGDGKHPAFRQNIANRLWAVVFGRGLVEPLDLHHSANPPSNPELLDLLAEQIAVMKFDMRAFVRELALTQAFQRSLDLPAVPSGVAQIKDMLPGLEKQAAGHAAALTVLEDQFRKEQKALVDAQLVAEPTRAELTKLDAAIAAAQKGVDDAAVPLKKAGELVEAKRKEHLALLAEEAKLKAELAKISVEKTEPAVAAVPANAEAKASPPATPPAAPPAPAKPAATEAAIKALAPKIAAAAKALAALEKDAAAKSTVHTTKSKALVTAQEAAGAARTKMAGFAHGINELQTAFVALEARKEAARIKALDAATMVSRLKAALAAATSGGTKPEVREALASAWSRSFAANDLLPLTPEQLCWSSLQATGQTETFRKTSAAQYDAKNKPTEADKADPQKQAARAAAIEVSVREKQRGFEDQFVRAFGGAAGQPQTDFFATPEQALYFENGGVLRSWANALANAIATKPDARAMAEELYLAAFTRMPDASEIADVEAVIAARPEKKNEALADYAWALVTSVEFRFSH